MKQMDSSAFISLLTRVTRVLRGEGTTLQTPLAISSSVQKVTEQPVDRPFTCFCSEAT